MKLNNTVDPEDIAAERGRHRRRWGRWIVALGLAACWVSGLAGRAVTDLAAPRLLPAVVGRAGEITSLSTGPTPAAPARGALLTVSARRVRRMLREALPLARFLVPPGLIRDGLLLRGVWTPRDARLPGGNPIPVTISLDGARGDPPRLVARFPAEELNQLLKDETVLNLTRQKDWIFGEYEVTYRPRFDALEVVSDPAPRDGRIAERRLRVAAAGNVRIVFEEDLFSAKATAKVSRLIGEARVSVVRDRKGVGFRYVVKIERMDGSVDNLAPWADREVLDSLKGLIVQSANRERKQRKLAERRFPAWLPLDLDVDARLTAEE